MDREYITVTEAAKRMNVSRMTMSRAVNAKKYKTETVYRRPLLIWENGGLVPNTSANGESSDGKS